MALIGAHVDSEDPLDAAAATGAEAVQFFLGDPQGWKKPVEHPHADELRASDLTIYIHAPYLVNVASTNNKIRIPSRKIMQQHAEAAAGIGAKGLVVHGGHVTAKDDPQVGVENWRKAFERAEAEGGFPLPILIENTAGGDNALARKFDRLAMLWDAVGQYGPGFVLDTCHAWAGGEELVDIVDRVHGHHRAYRSGARQQLSRRIRLRRRPARQLRFGHVRLGADRRRLPRRRLRRHHRDSVGRSL